MKQKITMGLVFLTILIISLSSSFADPLVGFFNDTHLNNSIGLTKNGDTLFVLSEENYLESGDGDGKSTIVAINVTDINNMNYISQLIYAEAGDLFGESNWIFSLGEDYIFTGNGDSGAELFPIIDVSDNTNMVWKYNYDPPLTAYQRVNEENVFYDGETMFIMYRTVLYSYNISNPLDIFPKDLLIFPEDLHTGYYDEETKLLYSISGSSDIYVHNLTDPNNLIQLSKLSSITASGGTFNYLSSSLQRIGGNYLISGCNLACDNKGYVWIFDISDPTNLTIHSVSIMGVTNIDYFIYNAVNPNNPISMGAETTSSATPTDLMMWDFSDLNNPSYVTYNGSTYSETGHHYAYNPTIHVDDNYVYMADNVEQDIGFGYINIFTLDSSHWGIFENISLLPTISIIDPIPEEAEVNETITWSVGTYDPDSPVGEIWLGFDCDNDLSLEYPLAYRGVLANFNCTYESSGIYTGVAYTTDDDNYPSTNLGTSQVTIYDNGTLYAETPTGGDCTGFIEPTCLTNELFCDDFSYNNPISCNGWDGSGSEMNPINNELHIYGLGYQYYDFEYDFNSPITESDYLDFSVEFDFMINTSDIYQFNILNEDKSKYSIFMVWNNYKLSTYSDGESILMYFNQSQTYNFRAEIDIVEEEINYYLDDNFILTDGYYDSEIDNFDEFSITWSSTSQDFIIDDFSITSGTESPTFEENATETITIDYEYDSDFFCGINWTRDPKPEFSRQNIIERGYTVDDSRYQLAFPRACISDTGSAIFEYFTNNVLMTIIILIIIILLVPLLIKSK